MNDPITPIGWEALAKAAWGLLVSILSVLGLIKWRQIEKHEEDLTKLRAVVLTKDDLSKIREDRKADMKELEESLDTKLDKMHEQNVERLERIHETQNMILKKMLEG